MILTPKKKKWRQEKSKKNREQIERLRKEKEEHEYQFDQINREKQEIAGKVFDKISNLGNYQNKEAYDINDIMYSSDEPQPAKFEEVKDMKRTEIKLLGKIFILT